jgi:hypothetical protein
MDDCESHLVGARARRPIYPVSDRLVYSPPCKERRVSEADMGWGIVKLF